MTGSSPYSPSARAARSSRGGAPAGPAPRQRRNSMAVSVAAPPLAAIAPARPDPSLPSLFGDQQQLTRVVRRIESTREPVSDPPFLDWLLGDSRRIARDADFFDEMCWRLVGAGLPLSRVNIAMRTLPPEILGFAFRWYRARRIVEVSRVSHGIIESDESLK